MVHLTSIQSHERVTKWNDEQKTRNLHFWNFMTIRKSKQSNVPPLSGWQNKWSTLFDFRQCALPSELSPKLWHSSNEMKRDNNRNNSFFLSMFETLCMRTSFWNIEKQTNMNEEKNELPVNILNGWRHVFIVHLIQHNQNKIYTLTRSKSKTVWRTSSFSFSSSSSSHFVNFFDAIFSLRKRRRRRQTHKVYETNKAESNQSLWPSESAEDNKKFNLYTKLIELESQKWSHMTFTLSQLVFNVFDVVNDEFASNRITYR